MVRISCGCQFLFYFIFFNFGGGCVWEGGVEMGGMVGMGHTKY